MQRFPVAVHDDWSAAQGLSADVLAKVREGTEMALAGLSRKTAAVESAGFAAKDGLPLVRARLRSSGLPGVLVWEQTINVRELEAAGVDFGGMGASTEVALALHSILEDFVAGSRSRAEKRHL